MRVHQWYPTIPHALVAPTLENDLRARSRDDELLSRVDLLTGCFPLIVPTLRLGWRGGAAIHR